MSFTILNTLALIVVILGGLKILFLLFAPKVFGRFAKGFYRKSVWLKLLFLVLAAVILFLLTKAGVTLIEIFAIMLFLSMLMATAFVDYGEKLIAEIDFNRMLKQQWLFILIWVVLIVWVIKDLFFV